MLDHTLSRLASAARLGYARDPGAALGPRPERALVLYEFEGCPMCRRVREALTDLALPVEVRPCPRGGSRFRPEATALAGKTQFPFLVDPNTERQMLESSDIVAYLYATYGTGEPPHWLFGPTFMATAHIVSMLRAAAPVPSGRAVSGSVVLRGNESDPAARRIREALCALEIPYRRVPGAPQLTCGDQVFDDADEAVGWLRGTR